MTQLTPRLWLTALLAVTSSAALAADCTFTTECFDAEGCAETEFKAALVENADGGARLVTDAQNISLSQGGSADLRVYFGLTPSSIHLLSVSEAGPARYTTHIFDGPIMVNYVGVCE